MDGKTIGQAVLTEEHSLTLLNDLGVKASDVLQSNGIIWVEGLSDRIYLNRWIKLVAPDLTEGQDYSIMLFGGLNNLSSSISVERSEQTFDDEELIQLLKICQHAYIVMDSGKTSLNDVVDDGMKRIQDECNRSGTGCWITDGYEIENYLTPKAVIDGTQEFEPNLITFSLDLYEKFDEKWRSALIAASARERSYKKQKPKYAREFCKHFDSSDMSSHLRACINDLVQAVRSWNQ